MHTAVSTRATSELLNKVLDAMPGQVFVCDKDFKVYGMNIRARNGTSSIKEPNIQGGGLLNCLNYAEGGGKCLGSEACDSCFIRSIIKQCIEKTDLCQKKVTFAALIDGKPQEKTLFVSAAPFQFEGNTRVLLMIEDFTDLEPLDDLVSICAECKKIRLPDGTWEYFESYFGDRFGIDFSHAVCKECLQELYPGFGKT